MSAGCRPADGSSRTYSTPNNPLPSCVARCSRWNSPADSVEVVRSVLEVAEAEFGKGFEMLLQVADQRLGSLAAFRGQRRGVGMDASRAQQLGQVDERERGRPRDVDPGDGDAEREGIQPPPLARRTRLLDEEGRGLRPQRSALRRGVGVQNPAARRHVCALIGPRDPMRLPHRMHRHHRLLLGGQQPVPLFGGQSAERRVDVDPQLTEDVAVVLPLPRAGPRGDGAFADAQVGIADQLVLVDGVARVRGHGRSGRRRPRCWGRTSRSPPARRPAGRSPAREYSMRSTFETRLTVPTLDRALPAPYCCRSATAGGRPLMLPTRGAPACSMSRRA